MKNQKGITLITLVITIVVMIIIAGVATYSGIESVKSAQITAFKTELEMIQAKVNVIHEKRKKNDEEKSYYDNLGQDITQLNEETLLQVLGESSKEGFRYFSKENLTSIELDDINQNVIINFDTCEVISTTGIEIDGVRYYKLKTLPNYNWHEVKHVNKNTEAKEITIDQTKLSDSYRITIKDANGKDINTGSLSYKLHNSEDWLLNGNNMSFIVNELGIYDIKYTDTAGNETIKKQFVPMANYTTDGIIAYYDAENNIGTGHSNTTSIWKDLTGNRKDAKLNDIEFNDTSGWREKAIQLDTENSHISYPVPIPTSSSMSVEIVLTQLSYDYMDILYADTSWSSFAAHTWNDDGSFYIGGNYNSSEKNRFIPTDINYKLPLNEPVLLTYTYNANTNVARVYINGEKRAEKVYVTGPEEITSFTTKGQGQYHRVSIYNKELTQEEITNNYETDKYRFDIKE